MTGVESSVQVDLRALRSWLAKQHSLGHARATCSAGRQRRECSSLGLTKRTHG